MLFAAGDLPAPRADWAAIAPELVLIGTGLLVLLMLAIRRFARSTWYAVIAAVGTLVAAGFSIDLWRSVDDGEVRTAFSGMVAVDGFGAFLVTLVCVVALLAILLADAYLRREGSDRAEYYILVLFSAAGMQFMVVANNLIMMFIALELLSVCLYILAAWHRDRPQSQEAGMKYLLLGAYASAILLFGIAFLYGASGTTNLLGLQAFFAQNALASSGIVLAGMLLVVVGLSFKVAVVPFHMWAPDVYQGAPLPVVAFMAAGAKIAGFAGLWRVLEVGLTSYEVDWQPVLWVLAALTMLVGSVLAIVQRDVKRMLAYSSIAHAGFILTGLVAANETGTQGSLFYLVAYSLMVIGAFGLVMFVARRGERNTKLDDYRGLSRDEPVIAAALAFFLFAMAGIPGTSGFVAKFSVFSGLADANTAALWFLVGIGTVASVVSAYFYLRLVVYMYLRPPADEGDGVGEGDSRRLTVPVVSGLVVALTALMTLGLGILPEGLLDIAGRATLLGG